MAARTSPEIEQIKDRIDLQDYIGRAAKLEKHGDHVKTSCTFHGPEKTPSMHIWPDHFKCFGCGKAGDLFTFYQERNNVSFRTALTELAVEAGVSLRDDPEAEARHEQHQATVSLYRAAAELYHSALTPEAREYLHGRGYQDKFIDEYLIGQANGNGQIKKLDRPTADLEAAQLLNDKGRDVLWGRIVLPIWGRYDSEIIGLAGRAWPNIDAEPKYLSIPGGPAPLLNERGLRSPTGRRSDGSRFIFLVEGDTDTATLVQAKRPVVGVRGANGLQDSFRSLFERVESIYVCADGDKAGIELIQKAGRIFGNRVRVVVFPADEDTSSFVNKNGIEALDALARTAKPYIDWMIDRLPQDVPPEEIDRYLAEFGPALVSNGAASQEAYTKRLSRRLGISAAPIKALIKEMTVQVGVNGTHTNGVYTVSQPSSTDDDDVVWDDTPTINPVQALADGVMYTVVYLDKRHVNAEGIDHFTLTPYVITSNKERFELSEADMWRRGLRYSKTKVPAADLIKNRWRSSAGLPNSIKAYLSNQSDINPLSIYQQVSSYFRRFLHYPQDAYHDFLSCWVIGTYFFEIFPSYPYVHLTGAKRAGKTTTLDIVAGLAFNARNSSSISTASIFRIIESTSPTLLIDEAENLQKRGNRDESNDEKLEILKAGYKKGSIAIRCVGDDYTPTGFQVYSPKMFGSVGNIDRILADRVISLILERKPNSIEVEEFRESEMADAFSDTRDQLYCLMLDHGAEVEERLRQGIGWQGVRDRDRELWTPILVIAEMIDDYAVQQTGEPAVPGYLVKRMREMATGTVVERSARDRHESTEALVLEGILAYMDVNAAWNAGEWYHGQHLLSWLVDNHDGLQWMKTTKHIYDQLEKVLAIKKSTDLMPIKNKSRTKTAKCVKLNRQKIESIYTGLNGE